MPEIDETSSGNLSWHCWKGKLKRVLPPLKLHTKITILISAITIAVMLAMVLLISVRMATLVQEDEKELARLQALSIAEQISLMPLPRAEDDLLRAVEQAHGSRPGIIAVRYWERQEKDFVERIKSSESQPESNIDQWAREILSSSAGSEPSSQVVIRGNDIIYQVIAPVLVKDTVNGAVIISERLDSLPSIVRQYTQHALWLMLLAVILMALAVWLSCRSFVYHPLQRLLQAISRTGGEVEGTNAERHDELGRASMEYNRMLEQVQSLTSERERQQEVLRERVREATSELQQRNQQLATANAELWETSRRLSQMERLAVAGQTAALFAHEVGTPLNTIGIHVELLREALADHTDAAKRTEIIGQQIERIERIVRGMLDRTRVEKPVLKPVDLRLLLMHMNETTEPMMQSHRVKLNTRFAADLPYILGDADRLQQMFINLINNAIDAMPAGGELWIRINSENGQVIVEFADTGCGMDRETRERIFEPLYTTKERGRGTGLGLVVVRQIIEEHAGTIAVESQPGRGSHFRLTFPVAEEQLLAESETAGKAAQ